MQSEIEKEAADLIAEMKNEMAPALEEKLVNFINKVVTRNIELESEIDSLEERVDTLEHPISEPE